MSWGKPKNRGVHTFITVAGVRYRVEGTGHSYNQLTRSIKSGLAAIVNGDNGGTVHQTHGSYVSSVFDVVHDNGGSTGLYASKTKFFFIDRSWNELNGADDVVGEDNGKDKIDVFEYLSNTDQLISTFIQSMRTAPHQFSLVHLFDPDSAGQPDS